MHAEQHDVLVQTLPEGHVPLALFIAEEGLLGRQKVLLQWEDRACVVQPRFRPPAQPLEREAFMLLDGGMHFAELLRDRGEEIQLAFGQFLYFHCGTPVAP
jgi:hypothetical protein